MAGNVEVVHNEAKHRFEAQVGDQTAVLTYGRSGDEVRFTHTVVPEELEGQGIGGALAHTGLEWARSQHLRVKPLCTFIAAYLKRHPEYQDLVEENRP